jgi:hypothetical protein
MVERFKDLSLLSGLLLSLALIALLLSPIFLFVYWNRTSACHNLVVQLYPNLAPECREYWNAVRDASAPESSEISRNLKAIPEADASLKWQGEPGDSRLLVVTWTSEDEFDEGDEGKSLDIEKEIWVTAVPDLKERCRRVRPRCHDSTLRLEQLLGLPAKSPKTQFVELWVWPSNLFRPCPDPEVSDTVCELRLSSKVSRKHAEWFNDERSGSYGWLGYPWTRLGYSYDWGNPQSDIGLSEFVIEAGANIKVESVTPTDRYLQ